MSDPRPTVGPATEALYARLPELYREADAAQDTGPNNYPLLRFLSGILDQLTPVIELIARLSYVPLDDRYLIADGNSFGIAPPWQRFGDGLLGDDTYGDSDTADLVDPYTANAGWLPWLAQLLGINLAGLAVDEQRATLANPADAWAHGTPDALKREARRQAGAAAYVDVQAHHGGDPFVIGIITKNDESYGTTTFAELKEIAPTWADLEALGSYGNAETAAIMLAADVERPAGYQLAHAYL